MSMIFVAHLIFKMDSLSGAGRFMSLLFLPTEGVGWRLIQDLVQCPYNIGL